MIARLEVTRGTLTEYPLAEKVRDGWQNGVTFYPDAEVTKVTPLQVQKAHTPTNDERIVRALDYIENGTMPPDRRDWLRALAAGFRRTEPQGEPSDAELLKLANDAHHRMVDEAESDGGWYGFSHSRDAWEDGFATGYRARAASSVTEQGEAEKPRCGGGRTHCRHDQWPPMHSMACPISKAAVTEQGENR